MAQPSKTLPLNRRSIARGLNNHAELIEAMRAEVLRQRDQIDALLDGKAQTDKQLEQHEALIDGYGWQIDGLINRFNRTFWGRLRWLVTGR